MSPDQITQTTQRSWFQRLGSAFTGVLVGLLIVAAGAMEIHGNRQLGRRNADGMRWLVRSQLFLLSVVLVYAITRGGPINATHLMATLSFQRAIPGGFLGEGAAIATAMIPFLLSAILFSYFGLQRRRWQHGGQD